MKRSLIETLLGGIVLLIAGFFVVFAYNSSNLRATSNGYSVIAIFDKLDGVKVGTDVKISGIKVGNVAGISLDPETYLAKMVMHIDKSIKIPTDTVVSVGSDGLLGGSYVSLSPGADDEYVTAGGILTYTQSPISLTDMLSRFVFSMAEQGNDSKPNTNNQNPFSLETE